MRPSRPSDERSGPPWQAASDHGVTFEQAVRAFRDLFAVERIDDREDYGIRRPGDRGPARRPRADARAGEGEVPRRALKSVSPKPDARRRDVKSRD